MQPRLGGEPTVVAVVPQRRARRQQRASNGRGIGHLAIAPVGGTAVGEDGDGNAGVDERPDQRDQRVVVSRRGTRREEDHMLWRARVEQVERMGNLTVTHALGAAQKVDSLVERRRGC